MQSQHFKIRDRQIQLTTGYYFIPIGEAKNFKFWQNKTKIWSN